MELQFNEAERRFQTEVRDFIAANLPNDLREKTLAGNSVGKEGILRWHGILARRGWRAPAWPSRYGGSGWSVTQRYIFEQESARAGTPDLLMKAMLFGRAKSIWGGSNEIQHNLIAKHVLGL